MSIVLSIKPQFTNKILDGSKTIEMRTKIGKKFINGSKVIIYSSSPCKAIVAIAKIKKIQHLAKHEINDLHLSKICITREFFDKYMEKRSHCYLMELSEIYKLNSHLPLAELRKLDFTPPQSFCYSSKDLENLVASSL